MNIEYEKISSLTSLVKRYLTTSVGFTVLHLFNYSTLTVKHEWYILCILYINFFVVNDLTT